MSVTFDPFRPCCPQAGSSPTTIPCGWLLLVTGTSETVKPARWSTLRDVSTDSRTAVGTTTLLGPA